MTTPVVADLEDSSWGVRRVLRQRDFRRVWVAGVFATVAGWIESTALAYYVADRFASPLAAGLISASAFAPALLAGPVGGRLADTRRARNVLVWALAAQSGLLVALWAAVDSGSASLPVLCALAAAFGTVIALEGPVWQAFLIQLVTQRGLVAAVTLGSVQFNAARAVGPWLAGALIGAGQLASAFLVSAVGTALVLLAVLRIPAGDAPTERRPGGLGVAWRHVRAVPALTLTLAAFLVLALLAMPFPSFLAVLATQTHEASAVEYSGLVSAFGAGGVLSALALPFLTRRIGLGRFIPPAFCLLGLCLAAVAAAPSLWALWPLLVLTGGSFVLVSAGLGTAYQLLVDPALRGRVTALVGVVGAIALPLGSLLAGVVGELIGLRETLALSGALLAAYSLNLRRAVRSLPDEATAELPTAPPPGGEQSAP